MTISFEDVRIGFGDVSQFRHSHISSFQNNFVIKKKKMQYEKK